MTPPPPRPVEIIRAGHELLDLIAPLFNDYRGFYAEPGDLDASRAFIEERLRLGESVIFLAVAGLPEGDLGGAGFVQLYPIFSSVRIQRKWLLNDLYVAPPYRRAGVGRRLMERAVLFARETGSRGLELCTGIENTAAQRLYESLGFVRDAAFHHYRLDLDA
jgi:ribosomal protein S18 acetylase RimI-like enzyme